MTKAGGTGKGREGGSGIYKTKTAELRGEGGEEGVEKAGFSDNNLMAIRLHKT